MTGIAPPDWTLAQPGVIIERRSANGGSAMTDNAAAAAFRRAPFRPDAPRADEATIERNVAAARRFVEDVLGGGDMAAFDELVADDVWVSTGLKPGSPVHGKTEYGQVLGRTVGAALSNGTMTVHEVLPTLDGAVLVRFTAEADHTGEADGVAPTGRRFTLSETHLMRFRDGKLVENYVGALNPLHWETTFAPAIAKVVF
jgi:ketosteroid isomerase-like protein